MKVAYLLGSLNRGGLETLMLDVCQNLTAGDFEAIALYRKGGILEQEFLNSKVPMKQLKVGKNIFRYLLRLRRYFTDNRVEIVHAQQSIDALLAKIACIGKKIKIVQTFHGFDYNDNKCLVNFVIHCTNSNIFVSSYQREYYTKKYKLNPSKQCIIYNGINFDKLKTTDNKPLKTLKKELNLSHSTILLGMVGNFNEVRDQLTVCRFLKLLNEQNIDFRFIFVGKCIDSIAERYNRCVEFCHTNSISPKVSFLGVRNDVPQILSQLDAFVYATDHDTFGIAVVEAIASGIPVFVNDWAVMQEITQGGKLATLYKTKDENDLLQKFMLFLQNRAEMICNAHEASHIASECYGIRKFIENLKTTYIQVLSN